MENRENEGKRVTSSALLENVKSAIVYVFARA